jgi:hypothetical protein
MIYLGEGIIKCLKVAPEGRVAVTVKGCTRRLSNGFNGNFLAVEFSLSIMEVMHFLSYPQITLIIIVLASRFCRFQ